MEDLNDSYKEEALSYFDSNNEDRIDFYEEASQMDPTEIKAANANGIREVLQLGFNAAANLRYGDGSSNSGIGENFDPMGDMTGTITTKEDALIEILSQANMLDMKSPEKIGNEYYLRSGTGLYTKSNPADKWFIKCRGGNMCY